MLSAEQFQTMLRDFKGPLAGVEVKHKSEAAAMFLPHKVDVTGVCNIHGKPVVFEVEDLDLRSLRDADDVIGFAGKLLESFQTADAAPQLKALQAG